MRLDHAISEEAKLLDVNAMDMAKRLLSRLKELGITDALPDFSGE